MFFVQINHTGKGFLFLIFREIKLRKYSSLHKLFYGLNNKHTNSSNANKTNHKFSETVPVKSIKTLTYAVESDSPFTGIFLPELSDTTIDSEVQSPGLESLFQQMINIRLIIKELLLLN